MAAGHIDDPRWNEVPPPPRRLNRLLAVAIALPLVLTIVAMAASVRSRVEYGTAVFWSLPNRINYCGRRYYPSPMPVSGTPASLSATITGTFRWRTVGRTFSFRPIEGPILRSHEPGGACAASLYIPIGRNRYRLYDLSGSP